VEGDEVCLFERQGRASVLMGFKARSKRLVPLDIKCNHLGTTEYWCHGCAYIAAEMLRRDFEEQDAKIETLAGRLECAARSEDPESANAIAFRGFRRQVLSLRRWPKNMEDVS
jgi:hypothetical protein